MWLSVSGSGSVSATDYDAQTNSNSVNNGNTIPAATNMHMHEGRYRLVDPHQFGSTQLTSRLDPHHHQSYPTSHMKHQSSFDMSSRASSPPPFTSVAPSSSPLLASPLPLLHWHLAPQQPQPAEPLDPGQTDSPHVREERTFNMDTFAHTDVTQQHQAALGGLIIPHVPMVTPNSTLCPPQSPTTDATRMQTNTDNVTLAVQSVPYLSFSSMMQLDSPPPLEPARFVRPASLSPTASPGLSAFRPRNAQPIATSNTSTAVDMTITTSQTAQARVTVQDTPLVSTGQLHEPHPPDYSHRTISTPNAIARSTPFSSTIQLPDPLHQLLCVDDPPSKFSSAVSRRRAHQAQAATRQAAAAAATGSPTTHIIVDGTTERHEPAGGSMHTIQLPRTSVSRVATSPSTGDCMTPLTPYTPVLMSTRLDSPSSKVDSVSPLPGPTPLFDSSSHARRGRRGSCASTSEPPRRMAVSPATQEHRARLAKAGRDRKKKQMQDLQERVSTFEHFIEVMRMMSDNEGVRFPPRIEHHLAYLRALPPLSHRSSTVTPPCKGSVYTPVGATSSPTSTLVSSPPYGFGLPTAKSPTLSDATPTTASTSIFSQPTHERERK